MSRPVASQERPVCPTCRQHHIDFVRPEGYGFVCNYRQPDEHYHDTEEERAVLCGDDYTPQQYERAAKAMQARQGTRGKHARKPRQRPADKPTSGEGVAA